MIKFIGITCFLLFGLIIKSLAQEYEDATVLWRGFQHRWTYNHRLNRLGSRVDNPNCQAGNCATQVINTAASGTGADKADFTTYISTLAANGVRFKTGSVTLRFSGKEGEESAAEKAISLVADSGFINRQEYIVVLNGFDLVSEQKADKLLKLSVGASEGYYDGSDRSLHFDIYGTLNMVCNSPECECFKNTYAYQLTVNYLLIAGDSLAFLARKANLHRKYFWDKRSELQENAPKQLFKGDSTRKYAVGIPALQSFTIELDVPHWFLEWHTCLEPYQYNPQNGTYAITTDFFFKQWRKNMKRYSYSRKYSRWSKRKSGVAILSTRVVLLQFKEACVRNLEYRGTIKWGGKNQTAVRKEAESAGRVPFYKSCR